jgi:hypothetical protein
MLWEKTQQRTNLVFRKIEMAVTAKSLGTLIKLNTYGAGTLMTKCTISLNRVSRAYFVLSYMLNSNAGYDGS